jgi:23S rRNA U2552 (ribose-2'-O)-methylase RlmE/FtsJ
MESASLRDSSKPWENLRIYKRNGMNITNIFELESKESNHTVSEEEATLHEYRNRISEYETGMKQWEMCKKIINPGENVRNWEYYKKIVNPYELVYTQRKYDEFPESICCLKPLSRSYFKMVEMLEIMKFFDTFRSDNVRAAHVCEGPGGFIEALFDEAFKNKKKVQTSIAMTLKSKQTNVPGWKRASQFLQKNRNVRILYGQDDTGDIMKPENQQFFIDYCIHPAYGGKMNIFTADGGFDFSCDYSKQEKMIFPLLLASTKIGLEVLKKGGVFILKMFDFYEKATVDLLYFLSCHFSEWTLYKPAMSSPCNPEQYFIGKGFTGCTDEVSDVMRLWCSMLENNQPVESLFNQDLPNSFMTTINNLRTHSFNRQTEYLEKVFFIIEKNDDTIIQNYLKKNEKTSYDWCNRFRVPISPRRHLAVDSQTYPPISSQ